MNTKIPAKSNLENSRSEFEQCTSIEKVWCTPHWGTDIWILYSRPTDTLHRNIEIHHPPVFNTHLKLLELHSSYRTQMLRYVGIYKCICAEVLLSTGAVRRVKSMSGSKKSQGGWLLPTELWDRKMRGRLYMRRWALEMNLELHFLIFHTHTKFSPFTKRRIENQIFFMEHVLI